MKKIHLAFLWHQHQPIYKNPVSGVYELPWVRLHACKDYYDTAAILDEFPNIKANFNLVPSLMVQLNEYALGIAHDKHMDLTLKSADQLSEDDKVFILHDFFMANWDTMVKPYNRYKQLLQKRGRYTSKDDLKRIQSYFKVQEFRDLQLWFNLVWMDPYWQAHDDFIKSLFQKGEEFSEEDKHNLIKKQLEICGLIAGKYKELQERGQIEVSVTPFYHPILPLLCDTNIAQKALPNIELPKIRFQHRMDAKIQIQKAVDYYKECFGVPPRGMWPSEGSVSEDVIPIFAQNGIKWIATDEEILFRTQPQYGGLREKLYQPYRLDVLSHKMNVIFRDHILSDSVGFIYSRWNSEHAVSDFIKRIHTIRDSINDSPGSHLISVILDGENCWEFYPKDGWDFLRQLYNTLSNDPSIETVTISDYLEKEPPRETLKELWPGSWIGANYGIWIGHPEDNLAWDYLSKTRKFLTDYIAKNPAKSGSKQVESAWEKIYMAEGSDWNWWFGEDHSSGNDATFDYLFRYLLIGVYESLGEKIPEYLYKAIKGIKKKRPTLEPIDFISPNIDGKVTNYFEWHPAGYYEIGHSGGSMHQVETVLRSFYYGFDLKQLYIRLDLNFPIKDNTIEDLSFKITFLNPQDREAVISFEPGGNTKEFILKTPFRETRLDTAKASKIIEIALPIEELKLSPDDKQIEFALIVEREGSQIERWPYQSSVIIPKPSTDFTLKSWSV